jgi:curved DNA-binding protein CbpA
MKSHYQTLGVPKDANTEAIKAAFRKLSLETHPDVAAGGTERFKEIANAARVLTNPEKRRIYDQQAAVTNQFYRSFVPNHPTRARRTTSSRGTHGMLYTMYHPRNLVLGPILFFSAVSAFQCAFGTNEKVVEDSSSSLVQAWKNAETGEFEQPAPWDPEYRKLNPKLHLVRREDVRPRSIRQKLFLEHEGIHKQKER